MFKKHLSKIIVSSVMAMTFVGCAPKVVMDLSEFNHPIMLGDYVGPNKLKLPESATVVKKNVEGFSLYDVDRSSTSTEITITTTTQNTLKSSLNTSISGLANPCVINLKIAASGIRKFPRSIAWTDDTDEYVWYKCDVYDVKK